MHEFFPRRVSIQGEIAPPQLPVHPRPGGDLSLVKEHMDKVGNKILKHFNATRVTLAEIDRDSGVVTIFLAIGNRTTAYRRRQITN